MKPIPPLPKKKWTKIAWDQIRAFSKGKIIRLLNNDPRWIEVDASGSQRTFRNHHNPKPHDYVSIHFHTKKETFRNPNLLKTLLNQICWTEISLRQDKIIK